MSEFGPRDLFNRAAIGLAGTSLLLGACAAENETTLDPASTIEQEHLAGPVGIANNQAEEMPEITCEDSIHPVEVNITNPNAPVDLTVIGDSMVTTSTNRTHELAAAQGINVLTIAQKGAELEELREEVDEALANDGPVIVFFGHNNAATLNQCGDSLQGFQEVADQMEAQGNAAMITVNEDLPGYETEAAARSAAAKDINEIIAPVSDVEFTEANTIENGNVFEADNLDWNDSVRRAPDFLSKDGVHPSGFGSYHLATMYINFFLHQRAATQ